MPFAGGISSLLFGPLLVSDALVADDRMGLFLQFTSATRAKCSGGTTRHGCQHGSPVIEAQVEQVLQQLKQKSVVGGPVGTIAAILAAIGVFAQLDRGFDRVWRIPPRRGQSLQRTVLSVLHHRLFAFFMLLCLGGMVVGLFIVQMAVTHMKSMASSNVPLLSNFFHPLSTHSLLRRMPCLFGMVYKWLPKKRRLVGMKPCEAVSCSRHLGIGAGGTRDVF